MKNNDVDDCVFNSILLYLARDLAFTFGIRCYTMHLLSQRYQIKTKLLPYSKCIKLKKVYIKNT